MSFFVNSIFVLICFLFWENIFAQNFQQHIQYLASDSLEGRQTASKGELLAAKYISNIFINNDILPKGSMDYLQPFPFNYKGVHGEKNNNDTTKKTAFNIIGFIDNSAKKTVVIGAHYDHLGFDEYHNSTYTGNKQIHNGADDNASGIAMILELAKSLKINNLNKRNYLFIAFSGEELGLLGSNFFVNNSTIDLSNIDYMLNYDMVGRLDKQSKLLTINGVGTSPQFSVLKNIFVDSLKIQTTESGVGPSDHTSFYNKDIPVLHFFTGIHADYHKPSDDIDKINFEGLKSIFHYSLALIDSLDSFDSLIFSKTKDNSANSKTSFKVTLGIMPSYAFEGKGLKIDGVSEGKSASMAGILKGDIIIKMGKKTINDMQDYMNALSAYKKGNKTKVTILRGNEIVTTIVVF